MTQASLTRLQAAGWILASIIGAICGLRLQHGQHHPEYVDRDLHHFDDHVELTTTSPTEDWR